MASSSPPPPASTAIHIPSSHQNTQESELRDMSCSPVPDQTTPKSPANTPKASLATAPTTTTIDKAMSSVSNLAKLLPTGTVLAFQALEPSFTNHGKCYASNKYLTALLVYVCAVSCVFFAFTDSLVGRDGKLYYGLATFKGFYVFNFSGEDDVHREWVFSDQSKLRIRALDYVHAFFTALVFLTLAFSDIAVQECFFPNVGANGMELLLNLPLGAGFLSSIVFMISPSSRKGIGYTGINHHTQ